MSADTGYAVFDSVFISKIDYSFRYKVSLTYSLFIRNPRLDSLIFVFNILLYQLETQIFYLAYLIDRLALHGLRYITIVFLA